jgi:hypothetical protein
MNDEQIINSLKQLFKELENKGRYGDTGYTANEGRMIAQKAIALIEKFQNIETYTSHKEDMLKLLKEGIVEANKYYEPKHGYNVNDNRNPSIHPHRVINPIYNALDLFFSEG